MDHKEGTNDLLPFLSQSSLRTWAQVIDAAPELNLTTQLQEITSRRHRLYFIRCTIRLHERHYHLRIAGLPPARNKMLGPYRIIDPPCYRVATIPRPLQEATATLKDATKVHPLQSGQEATFLSLSGILFVGSTAEQRYVLHEHLKDLGLAGPPAPILQWEGHLQKGPYDTHALPFRSLSVLPAELLAIPVPTTSWAFEEAPVMTFTEWDAYRRRSTSVAYLTPAESKGSSPSRGVIARALECLPAFALVWQLVCLLFSHLSQWSLSTSLLRSSTRVPPTVLPLCDQAWGTPQHKVLDSSSSNSSVESGSTELRIAPSVIRDSWCKFLGLLHTAHKQMTFSIGATQHRVCRPMVIVKGCSPKGYYVPVWST